MKRYVIGPRFPQLPPLAPPTPQPVARPCSQASSLLRRGLTSPARLFIIGFGSSPSRCGPSACPSANGQAGDLPVPVQRACAHARVYDHAGSSRRLRWRVQTFCLPQLEQRRHPVYQLCRGSMADLCVPLATLRAAPRGAPRMTRGQHDSLHLCCEGLAPLTPCWFYRLSR